MRCRFRSLWTYVILTPSLPTSFTTSSDYFLLIPRQLLVTPNYWWLIQPCIHRSHSSVHSPGSYPNYSRLEWLHAFYVTRASSLTVPQPYNFHFHIAMSIPYVLSAYLSIASISLRSTLYCLPQWLSLSDTICYSLLDNWISDCTLWPRQPGTITQVSVSQCYWIRPWRLNYFPRTSLHSNLLSSIR